MTKTSQKWELSLLEFDENGDGETVEPESEPRSLDEYLWHAEALQAGEFAGTGNAGDSFQLQFDAENALILYMRPAGGILRPQFRNRVKSGEGIEMFFCRCCGVQLGNLHSMLAECTTRREGFKLTREILNGTLPESDDLAWVELKPRSQEL